MRRMVSKHELSLNNLEIRQPFRQGTSYRSNTIAGLTIELHEPALLMYSNRQWQAISNAVHNGGQSAIQAAVNYRVSLDFSSDSPQDDLLRLLYDVTSAKDGLDHKCTAGFMTAAKLTHATVGELSQQDFSMFVLATAGTSNAVRAGSRRQTYPGYHAGTINIFIWLDARMSQAAIVNAIITATEAKSAALADLAVVEQANGLIATGTSTDAIFVAVSQHSAFPVEHQYAGAATELGCKLGELVYAVVHQAVRTQQER